MSTDPHHRAPESGERPHHDTVSFETRDVTVRTIYWYLIVLTVAVAASFLICVFVLSFTANFVRQSDTPMMPARAAMGPDYHPMPPEPRLQGVPGHEADPQQDRRDKVQADTEANEKYGWVDQGAGIAQIPVKEAMKIIAQKGLPAVAAPAPAPAEKK
jgi:hypothetical protein